MPTKQHRWIGQVLPAVELHPEPEVDEEVPEVLLTLHGRLVRTAQLPVTRALVQPADEAVIVLTTQSVHPGARLVGMFARLLPNLGRPLICSRHGIGYP